MSLARAVPVHGMFAALLLAATAASVQPAAAGADWPTWRYDAGRTAASPDALPEGLQLAWVRELPPPRPAWPASQPKVRFDVSYQPIIVGRHVIVGSTVDDGVTAWTTDTGELAWRFYTDGPVRFAPAAAGGRVYVASDDGHLYCLEAACGKLLWKVRGGPADRRIIGNGRLISTWPARTGPVVADGKVYFTASIWPSMGIFIHAVDADSGRIVWTNSETGSTYVTHPHGAKAFGSICPQGYLAAAGDGLILPGGRTLPAVLDAGTGKLRHFQFGGKGSGGWWAMATEKLLAMDKLMFRMDTGGNLGAHDLAVIRPDVVIGRGGAVYSAADSIREVEKVDRKGRKTRELAYKPKQLAELKPRGTTATEVVMVAGDRMYTRGKGEIAAFEFPVVKEGNEEEEKGEMQDEEEQKDENGDEDYQVPVWSAKIDGQVVEMIAGDDRLLVVTADHKLHCFAAGAKNVHRHGVESSPLAQQPDAAGDQARTLLKLAGTDAGFAVLLGIGTGGLAEELVRQSQLHVIAVDADAGRVAALRERMSRAGLYGTRLAAHAGQPAQFAFPPYLANLVVCQQPGAAGADDGGKLLAASFRVLRPYGGVACFHGDEDEHAALAEQVRSERLPGAEVSRHEAWTVVKRAGALLGSAPWTHQYADAANSVVSGDTLVRAPLGLLWFGGPSNDKVLPRHGHGPSPQVAGGRLFIEGPDMLRAVDVYTGRVHWEKQLPGVGNYYKTTRHFPGAGEIGSNYVSLADRVYVLHGASILALDSATGQTKRHITLDPLPNGDQPVWGSIAAWDDLLVTTSSPVKLAGSGDDKMNSLLKGFRPLVDRGAKWQYLAGTDPKEEWTSPEFKTSGWKTGPAGFGYSGGDDDDENATVLEDMRGRYTRVYLRKTFDAQQVAGSAAMILMVNYDDAFIAYLNGKEIARAGVGRGRGASARKIRSHEAKGHAAFIVADFRKLLKDGTNVLALEGHNTKITSSDFMLDPLVMVRDSSRAKTKPRPKPQPKDSAEKPALAAALSDAPYASASRRLMVFDRHTGELLWMRDAVYNFRHNAVAVADGKVFCIDGMSPAKRDVLKRRGLSPQTPPRLLALDARTGEEIWSTQRDVFGTFLNYSVEHDVLLEGGSHYRDRAKDEVRKGLVAHRGADGKVLWRDMAFSYNGPCLLWRDKIITNGASGRRRDLVTGADDDWSFRRTYGCNTIIGSQHLLTFRSGAAGYYDLAGGSGTGNFGGFRSSCTSNLIVADGVLNAPDFTRTCTCAYQNQTSLAMIHMPQAELWAYGSTRPQDSAANRIGINFGAPGDRRDAAGTLWVDWPSVGGSSPAVGVKVSGDKPRYVRHHVSRIDAGQSGDSFGLPWVASSAAVGIGRVEIDVADKNDKDDDKDDDSAGREKSYTVRLHFAEVDGAAAGQRLFDVKLAGRLVLDNLDPAAESGGPLRPVVKQFINVTAGDKLIVELIPHDASLPPLLSGIELIRDPRR